MNKIRLNTIRVVVAGFFLAGILVQDGLIYAQTTTLTSTPLIGLSQDFNPIILKGLKPNPTNPMEFDFIVDPGDVSQDRIKSESNKLVSYFLAALAIPEFDLWVNLSPYEQDRIIPDAFGQTEMGRDLLAQDYLLKQLTASLLHPDNDYGKKFWNKVYQEAFKKYGITDVPVDTFHKVWITPASAEVYEGDEVAYVIESKLKVMLEQDYLASKKNAVINQISETALATEVMRDIIIPAIEKEVNEGQHFVQLRQIYNSFILATWYKTKMKHALLSQIYADEQKIDGVNHIDSKVAQNIWSQYSQTFKQGIYDFIKEEYDPWTDETISRKYFSGGMRLRDINRYTDNSQVVNDFIDSVGDLAQITVDFAMKIEEANEDKVLTIESDQDLILVTKKLRQLSFKIEENEEAFVKEAQEIVQGVVSVFSAKDRNFKYTHNFGKFLDEFISVILHLINLDFRYLDITSDEIAKKAEMSIAVQTVRKMQQNKDIPVWILFKIAQAFHLFEERGFKIFSVGAIYDIYERSFEHARRIFMLENLQDLEDRPVSHNFGEALNLLAQAAKFTNRSPRPKMDAFKAQALETLDEGKVMEMISVSSQKRYRKRLTEDLFNVIDVIKGNDLLSRARYFISLAGDESRNIDFRGAAFEHFFNFFTEALRDGRITVTKEEVVGMLKFISTEEEEPIYDGFADILLSKVEDINFDSLLDLFQQSETLAWFTMEFLHRDRDGYGFPYELIASDLGFSVATRFLAGAYMKSWILDELFDEKGEFFDMADEFVRSMKPAVDESANKMALSQFLESPMALLRLKIFNIIVLTSLSNIENRLGGLDNTGIISKRAFIGAGSYIRKSSLVRGYNNANSEHRYGTEYIASLDSVFSLFMVIAHETAHRLLYEHDIKSLGINRASLGEWIADILSFTFAEQFEVDITHRIHHLSIEDEYLESKQNEWQSNEEHAAARTHIWHIHGKGLKEDKKKSSWTEVYVASLKVLSETTVDENFNFEEYMVRVYTEINRANPDVNLEALRLKIIDEDDQGMVVDQSNVGGIDLDSSLMDFAVTGEDGGIEFNFSPEYIQQLKQNLIGITPVIIDIQPISNLPLFLGLKNNEEKTQVAQIKFIVA